MTAKSSQAIGEYLRSSSQTMLRTSTECAGDAALAAEALIKALKNGGKVLICGNGGSAADSQHIATELMSSLDNREGRPALPAIALTTDTSFITAHSNDFHFDNIFARQVEALGRPGDVLIGLSTSGNSKNVVRAVERANVMGLLTVGFTGQPGGKVAEISKIALRVPSKKTSHVQEAHSALYHAICFAVEESIFAKT